jgi:hypothetical protein
MPTHEDFPNHPRETKLFNRASAAVLVMLALSSPVKRSAWLEPIELAGYEAMIAETCELSYPVHEELSCGVMRTYNLAEVVYLCRGVVARIDVCLVGVGIDLSPSQYGFPSCLGKSGTRNRACTPARSTLSPCSSPPSTSSPPSPSLPPRARR